MGAVQLRSWARSTLICCHHTLSCSSRHNLLHFCLALPLTPLKSPFTSSMSKSVRHGPFHQCLSFTPAHALFALFLTLAALAFLGLPKSIVPPTSSNRCPPPSPLHPTSGPLRSILHALIHVHPLTSSAAAPFYPHTPSRQAEGSSQKFITLDSCSSRQTLVA
jgi:hypothetical protein